MKSYARGRRFELLVVDKFRRHNIKSRRTPLSGQQSAQGILNADLIVEDKFLGKAKTTKAKKYVSFPEREILELVKKDLDFLVFNFKRTSSFVVIRFEDFVDLIKLWKKKSKK